MFRPVWSGFKVFFSKSIRSKSQIMPRGSILSEKERGMVEAFVQEGVPVREIGRRLGRSDKVIRNYLKDPEKYAATKRKPKKTKLSARDTRAIVRLASNSAIPLTKIKSSLNLNVCKETVRKALSSSSNIVRSKMNKTPNLSPAHKLKRLEFAKLNMARQWDLVIHSQQILVF